VPGGLLARGFAKESHKRLDTLPIGPDGTILQSAFPKKTVAALVVLAAVVYWAVDFELQDQWVYDAMNGNTHGAGAIQFFGDKETVEHWVEAHLVSQNV
jgi:hypothetical protein